MQTPTQLDQGLVRRVALTPDEGADVLFVQARLGSDRIQCHERIFSHHQLDRLAQSGVAYAARFDGPWTGHRDQLCLPTGEGLGHICGNHLQTSVVSPICEISLCENPHGAPELSVLGRAVRLTRERRNLSTDELARAIAIPRENIAALESGCLDPTYELLVAIAEGLGTQPSALVLLAEQLGRSHQP
jgi:DNA-binding XRE family transcriptional regulator